MSEQSPSEFRPAPAGLPTNEALTGDPPMAEQETTYSDAEGTYNLSNPYERAEQLLAQHGELFEKTERAWQKVRRMVQEAVRDPSHGLKGEVSRFITGGRYEEKQENERQAERGRMSRAQQLTRSNISQARANACRSFRGWARTTADWSDEAIQNAVNEIEPEPYVSLPARKVPQITDDFTMQLQDVALKKQRDRFVQAYWPAYAYQTLTAQVLTDALQDPDLVAPLIERLTGLASEGPSADREFPGLLESLAVYNEHYKSLGDIGKVLADAEREDLRESYIAALLSPEQAGNTLTLDKPMAALVAGIQLTAKAIGRKTGTPVENLAGLLLSYRDLWPDELNAHFEAHVKSYAGSQQRRLQDLLEPFLQRGRLPLYKVANPPQMFTKKQASGRPTPQAVILAREQRKAQRSNQGGKRESEKGDGTAGSTEDLRGETARPPRIKSFGYAENSSSSRQKAATLFLVGSLEALLEHPAIKAYIQRYSSEPDLDQVIRASIESIAESPFPSKGVKILTLNTHHMLHAENKDGDEITLQRTLREIKPQELAGVSAGLVSTDTRIFFDLPRINGERHFVFYGIGHKNELNKIPHPLYRR